MGYQSINPFDNKLSKSFDEITDEQLEAELVAATTCFACWRHSTYAQRAAIVEKAAKLLLERVDHSARRS